MIDKVCCLGLALLALILHETGAYQPGSYNDEQAAAQSGLSTSHSTYGSSSTRPHARPPINQRNAACSGQFRGLEVYAHDCHRYINCAEGRPVIQTCAADMAFNPTTGACDRQSKASCEGQGQAHGQSQAPTEAARSARLQQGEPRCQPGESGLRPHPYDCEKFLNCDNGRTFVQNCGPGTAFSVSLSTCDHKYKVDCGLNRSNGGATAHEQPVDSSVDLLGGVNCPEGARGKFPVSNDLRKYVLCGIGVKPRVEFCELGEIFDINTLACIVAGNPTSRNHPSLPPIQNDLLCPSGVEGSFVHPFDQTKFFNCKANKVAVQSCIPNYVFSISKGHCHPKTELAFSDYVAFIVSEISHEYSLILTRCPEGTEGLHLYPYDAGKYVRCAAGGSLSILSCDQDMAYSFSGRVCRPLRLMSKGDRVKFFYELNIQSSLSYTDSQAFQSALTSCPRSLQGNFTYPFHAGNFVLCQNGLLQVVSCPVGSFYSLTQRRCLARHLLSSHEFLDYFYTNLEYSTSFMQDLTTVTCPTNAQGYYLHPFDCTKYLICRNQLTSIESCEQGQVFSISKRSCVTRDQVKNSYDRVEYLTETKHDYYEEREGRQQYQNSQNLNGEVTCPAGVSGLHPHPDDCKKFLQCASGQTFVQDCAPGTAFHPITRTCDHLSNVPCKDHVLSSEQSSGSSRFQQEAVEPKCEPGFSGLQPHPYDCEKFLNCANGRTFVQNCGPGTAFSVSLSTCDHKYKVDCGLNRSNGGASSDHSSGSSRFQQEAVEPKCEPGFSGLQPHPYDCEKFLNCANGRTFVQNCGPGTAFSVSLSTCDHKYKVDCGLNRSNGGETSHVQPVGSSGKSLDDSICPEGARGKFPVSDDPRKYVLCGIGVKPRVEFCELGEIFDINTLACIVAGIPTSRNQPSLPARINDLLCPSGVEGLFVHPFDQTKFLNCKANQVAVQSCIPNNVFSISKGFCHPKTELAFSDYVAFIVSEISHEYSLILTRCPEGTDGLHLYPYDAGKYVRCAAGGSLSILSCDQDMAYSFSGRACRPLRLMSKGDRVKFYYELNIQRSFSYTESQAFQSALTSCPRSLQGNFTYPFHGRHFVLCQNGLLQVVSCPVGTLYSLSKRRCLAQNILSSHEYLDYFYTNLELSSSFMQDLTTVTCPTNAQGYYLHPFDCTKYLICRDQQTSIESCEQGQVFSISKRACVTRDQVVNSYDRVEYLTETQHEFYQENQLAEGMQLYGNVPNFNGEVACPASANGLHPHPYDCKKFLQCGSGQTFVQDCEPGTAFDSTTRTCDHEYKVDCSGRSRATDSTNGFINGASYRLACPDNVYGLYAHPFNAKNYLQCVNGHTYVGSCASTDSFSISRGFCVSAQFVTLIDQVATLNYNLDQSSLHSDFVSCPPVAEGKYVYPFDCTQYLSCEAGGITRLQSCPNGQHFSLSLNSCQEQVLVSTTDRVSLNSELKSFYEWWQQFQQSFQGESLAIICPSKLLGNYQHPKSPHKFISCALHHAQALTFDCPNGEVFSVSRRLCVPSTQVIREDRCDYDAAKSVVSYGWNVEHHDPHEREPKAHYGEEDQYASGSATRTSTIRTGDRWSTMNMQRPAGIGFEQYNPIQYKEQEESQSSGWSGQGSSYSHQAPTKSVLYVEGSLVPNRNYAESATSTITKTPLAPMAPTTSNVYYAQPVDDEEAPSNWPRQSFSRKVDTAPGPNDWRPLCKEPTRPASSPAVSLPGQRPLNLDYNPEGDVDEPYPTYRNTQQQPCVPIQPSPNHRPNSGFQPSPPSVYDSNLYGGLQPPRTPQTTTVVPTTAHLEPSRWRPLTPALPGQKALDLDYNPNEDRQTSDPGLTTYHQDVQPGHTQQRPPSFYPPAPALPANHSPNYRDSQPTPSEPNPYAGFQPPTPPPRLGQQTTPSSLRTFPIFPPVFNSTSAQQPHHPHYSRPYAEVAHSHNASWHKVPARAPDPFNEPEEEDDYVDSVDTGTPLTTSERSDLRPPPFDHHFYNPNQAVDPNSQTALNEALRLMLRPYFNHSGNAQKDQVEKTESAIATSLNRPPTASTPVPIRTTRRTPSRTPDEDVELIVAGEQESLDETDIDSVVADAGETSRTEQTLHPTTHATGYDTTDFQRSTRRVDVDSTTAVYSNPESNNNNWQTRGHSRGFHLRHPNMPDPFEKPQQELEPHNHHFHHNHDFHQQHRPQHQHHHHRHEHSRAFHEQHPNVPNPFPAQPEPQPNLPERDDEESDVEFLPNPNAESITPRSPDINLRSAFAESCEFDCGGGKCVKRVEVCDGVNNCGNRRDEQQCEHLGYQLRLTGGEKPHMGRIEVKVKGQWGYVCDDKFGLRNADVVCRELGYKMGAVEVRGSSYYEPPERNFNYVMDHVKCRGNETQLKDCDFRGWGVHNCGINEVAGVVCKVPALKCPNDMWLCHTSKECIPPAFVCDHTEDCADKSDESDAVCKAPIEFRLEGGRSQIEGRLEVKYHGVWGSVCDDDFNQKSAQVACNSLGYYGQAKIEKNIFGPGSGPIWLDQVLCFGNESSIDKCSHWNWGEHNCNHTEDVGVRCTVGPPPRQQRLRLQPVNSGRPTTDKQTSSSISLSDIGLWERSSKALRTPRRCGIFKDDLFDEFAHPEQRVVQGSIARRGRHPWQATIRTRGRGGISSHWCGAVVISKRHLLTAAHCLYGHPKGAYFVRVGDHYANIAENSEADTFIEHWYTHENFRKPTHMNNDIAVVVLKTPLRFSDYVQPICLPELGAPLLENRTCTISGWGSIKSGVSTPAQELRAAQLPILSDSTCKQKNVYGDAMTDGMFCAGSMDESVDACEGDSGGPLVCSDEDGETLYGIISWGQHCGYQNRPGVYVRVCHYVDWIYEKINQSLQRL